jgi:hypothetical protein
MPVDANLILKVTGFLAFVLTGMGILIWGGLQTGVDFLQNATFFVAIGVFLLVVIAMIYRRLS